ncbi:hypothetical protein H6796_03060 [Candidatus Nomurabacteria bacterium]|nr:hypothetical protein [Candidatus Nomurabacteria bacterium]
MTEVIKRNGSRNSEEFSTEKLCNSVSAACLAARTPEGEARQVADAVSAFVKEWSKDRHGVTSDDIRRIAHQGLSIFSPEAAYEYKNHKLVL